MDASVALRIERLNYILGGVAAAATALLLSGQAALGILVGAVISSVNFSLIRRLVQKMMNAGEDKPSGAAILFVPKMGVLIVAVTLAIYYLPVSPVAVAVGFSVFLVSIAVETVRFLTAQSHG